ncbi:MAG TPA: mandelate racemase/muconate lactonizing enzyme family protein [Chloroflexota bacterium]|nr:mandelate racemase/muconate lactonizing enzyme family protein [Chloroflexota bacterium]
MKITNVTTTALSVPGFRPIQDATIPPPKSNVGNRGGLFVHIHTDEGIQGLGFGTASPAIRSTIESHLKDLLIGEDPFEIEKLWEAMFWRVRGFGRKGIAFCAISSVDVALWDLKAKALGVPLYRLLGPYRDRVPIYGSGGWTNFSEAELVAEQVGYVERGMRSVKMKVGKDFGHSEREDVRRLAAVRKAVGDDVEILIDANNGYYAKQAITMAKEFEQYRVGWFEEPVLADDIDGLAAVARATSIPVATGEHEYTKFGFKDLIARGGADVVQPDVGRVGGITEWLKVAHLAHAFNLPVAPHAVALVHLHLACATPNLRIVEYLGVEDQGYHEFFVDFPQPKDGFWSPFPDRPGLGIELNPITVKKYSV